MEPTRPAPAGQHRFSATCVLAGLGLDVAAWDIAVVAAGLVLRHAGVRKLFY
jgi:hypothetical protein